MTTNDDTSLKTDLKANIRADFEKRYTSTMSHKRLIAATWLYPGYKTGYLTEQECLIATTKIKEEMMILMNRHVGVLMKAIKNQTINIDEGDND